jgi:hypothetical protein
MDAENPFQLVKDTTPAKKGKREFAGFKARLKVQSDDGSLSIDVPVRYAKIGTDDLVKIVRKTRNGKPVEAHYSEKKYYELGEDGKPAREITEADIAYFQVTEDGQEVEVQPFDRTQVIENTEYIPREQLEDYVIESSYEVWAEDEGDTSPLYKIATWLEKQKVAIASVFSFGGFTAYTALIYPVWIDGKFVLVMALSKSFKVYKHLMMPVTAEKQPVATTTTRKPLVTPLIKKKQQQQPS